MPDSASPTRTAPDPIAMEVFSNRLLSIVEEMGHTLIRSSFSTNIKERKDCSVAMFDAAGRLIAQASHVPLHLGSLAGGVRAVLARYPLEAMRPGDAFIGNDAYLAGGTHAPDIGIVTPVFVEGRVRFLAANCGHHSDVGGSVPGSTSHTARSVFEEGIRLPVLRIRRGGEIDTDLLEMIAHNTRDFEERMLDLNVQIATNDRGAALMTELAGRMGVAAVERAIDDLLAYTARRLRRRIAETGDNQGSFTTWLDDDGYGGDPVPVRATVTIRGERLTVDFTGSGPEARGSFNMPRNALEASVYYAVKAMLDPELMPNQGMVEAIGITAPEGTITNPRFPAAVGSRANTAQRVAGAVVGAFCRFLPPERRVASGNDVMSTIVFSGPARRGGRRFVYIETVGGGAGAQPDADGTDGTHVHVTNTSNLPAEALEREYPLLVEEYALVPDSGGAGEFRGGMGIARQIRSLDDRVVCHARLDGARRGPAGLEGGRPGGLSRVVLDHGRPEETAAPPKIVNHPLAAGRSLRIETPGAGGYGPPERRRPERIARDLADGRITPAAALADYGHAESTSTGGFRS
ncbi:hydantoinase B/oxoprolinase family protein [Azospirillum aestuarii]|uniref:hydantoinase B/oxoprolinase family protein n=1 Tax=Azospirillum aestuarii TaxID=2802052 RepID=UPI004054E58B